MLPGKELTALLYVSFQTHCNLLPRTVCECRASIGSPVRNLSRHRLPAGVWNLGMRQAAGARGPCPGAHPGCQVSVAPAGDSAPHGLTPGASGASRAPRAAPVGGDEASRSPGLHPVHQLPSCPFTVISHSVSMTVSDLGVLPGTPEPEDSGTPAQLVCLLAC